MEDRIPTHLIVSSILRLCAVKAVPAYVLHKGEAESGTIIVKVVMRGQGCVLQNQSRDIDGNLVWQNVFEESVIDEPRADAYIQRSRARDPDVWVVEIEDSQGANPFSV